MLSKPRDWAFRWPRVKLINCVLFLYQLNDHDTTYVLRFRSGPGLVHNKFSKCYYCYDEEDDYWKKLEVSLLEIGRRNGKIPILCSYIVEFRLLKPSHLHSVVHLCQCHYPLANGSGPKLRSSVLFIKTSSLDLVTALILLEAITVSSLKSSNNHLVVCSPP